VPSDITLFSDAVLDCLERLQRCVSHQTAVQDSAREEPDQFSSPASLYSPITEEHAISEARELVGLC